MISRSRRESFSWDGELIASIRLSV